MLTARHRVRCLILLAALAPIASVARADTPGRHPAYLHARSDLRRAQWLMRVNDDPNVMRRIHQADIEIDRAIHEIDRAAMFDHKNLDDHPQVDAGPDRVGRFRRVMELLRQSRADIEHEEDDPSAVGWRNLAFQHIDAAMNFVRRAAHDLRMERDLGW